VATLGVALTRTHPAFHQWRSRRDQKICAWRGGIWKQQRDRVDGQTMLSAGMRTRRASKPFTHGRPDDADW